MMRRERLFSIVVLVAWSFSMASFEPPEMATFVACTPADLPIKEILNIGDADVDFIRWEMVLRTGAPESGGFTIKLNYGKSQPNTLGFVSNGKSKSATGRVDVLKATTGSVVYRLTSDDFKSKLSLIKLSSNVLHILDKDERLMVGNGGWSYSLNKKNLERETSWTTLATISSIDLNKDETITFQGRTPCEPVNSEYHLALGEQCLKIKWLLKLYIDPDTHKPTSFYWNRTGHRSGKIDGTWSIETTSNNNIKASVCKLKPVEPFEPIDMLIVDENVMYFLDKNQRVMTGDENFSFAMNRVGYD